MSKSRFVLIGVAVLTAVLAGASANAAPVAANGSFSYITPGPNIVDTGNIASTTKLLTLGENFLGFQVSVFVDPYLGQPNNFCGFPSGGCTSQHGPGFLGPGSPVLLSLTDFPVSKSLTAITEHVVAETDIGLGGVIEVDFDFTTVRTTQLIATVPLRMAPLSWTSWVLFPSARSMITPSAKRPA